MLVSHRASEPNTVGFCSTLTPEDRRRSSFWHNLWSWTRTKLHFFINN